MSATCNLSATLFRRVNQLLRVSGYEVKKCERLPQHNLLGLRQINWQTIFDVGANTGQFATEYLSYFPNADVYSFEPVPSCFHDLRSNAARFSRWHCVNCALGSESGGLELYHHSDHSPSSSLLKATGEEKALFKNSSRQEKLQIQVQRLDDWVEKTLGMPKGPVLLKTDTQGYDYHVLLGAERVMDFVDAVICEVCVMPLYENQSKFSEIVRLLDGHSLEFQGVLQQHFSPESRVSFFDAVFFKHQRTYLGKH